MRNAWIVVPAAIFAGVLIVAGLQTWQGSGDLLLEWNPARPDIFIWAVRGTAIAVLAAAQMIAIPFVCGRLYCRGSFDRMLFATAAATFALATVGAVACGLAGR